ncbi:MAG TPA: TRAP transporter substrate-binding protein DctP, partial [Desulfosarcina sp.]|nr:TRAP transporter substrate-binding protein DctP [Desulfosarcina sp.]
MKKNILLLTTVFFLAFLGSAMAAGYTGPAIKAKLASEEIEGDFMTVWANKFAEHMKQWSGGKIEIEVYPYGTLGATGDINELAQMGVVQFVFSDHAWISSFVPQAQALALNYIFPTEKVPEVLDHMARKGEFLPLLEKAFRKNDLVPLSIMFEGWQWVTSKRPINSLDDMKGLKLRLMSSKLLVEDYKAYGASPTPMSYGEVYSGLQMG